MLRSLKVCAWLLGSVLLLGACGHNSSAGFTGPWFDAEGHEISEQVIRVDLGPKKHCGLQSVAFMTLGWPLGNRIEGDHFRGFIRDPNGILGDIGGGRLD